MILNYEFFWRILRWVSFLVLIILLIVLLLTSPILTIPFLLAWLGGLFSRKINNSKYAQLFFRSVFFILFIIAFASIILSLNLSFLEVSAEVSVSLLLGQLLLAPFIVGIGMRFFSLENTWALAISLFSLASCFFYGTLFLGSIA